MTYTQCGKSLHTTSFHRLSPSSPPPAARADSRPISEISVRAKLLNPYPASPAASGRSPAPQIAPHVIPISISSTPSTLPGQPQSRSLRRWISKPWPKAVPVVGSAAGCVRSTSNSARSRPRIEAHGFRIGNRCQRVQSREQFAKHSRQFRESHLVELRTAHGSCANGLPSSFLISRI